MPIPNEEQNQFKPGQSGNPNGRPKGTISQHLKRLGEMEDLEITIKTKKDGVWGKPQTAALSTDGTGTLNLYVASVLYQMAMNKDLGAIKELLNRTEGKVPQPLNLGGDGNGNVKVQVYMPDNKRRKTNIPDNPPADK